MPMEDMGVDTAPAEVSTASMETQATDNATDGETIASPLAEPAAAPVSDQASDQVEDNGEPKDLSSLMYDTIGEKVPEEEDNRTEVQKIATDEFKDAPWLNKYTSFDSLLKGHKAALDKLGERPEEMDFANATPEQLQNYYERARPEDVSSYEFPEGASDAEKDGLGAIFHKHGLHKDQAKGVMEEYNSFIQESSAQQYSQETFDKSMAVAVGENYNQKMPEIQKSIAQVSGSNVLAFVDKMPAALRASFYGYANGFIEKYGASESGVDSNMNDAGSVDWAKVSSDSMAQIRKLESDPYHKQADKDALVKRYKEAQLMKTKQKGNR